MPYDGDGVWIEQEDWDAWEAQGFNVFAGESPDDSGEEGFEETSFDEQVAEIVDEWAGVDVDRVPSSGDYWERFLRPYGDDVIEAALDELGW